MDAAARARSNPLVLVVADDLSLRETIRSTRSQVGKEVLSGPPGEEVSTPKASLDSFGGLSCTIHISGQIDASTGTPFELIRPAGPIVLAPDLAAEPPALLLATVSLLDREGRKIGEAGEVGHLSFYEPGRAFIDFRLRSSLNPGPYTSPPSGLSTVTGCRSNRSHLEWFRSQRDPGSYK